MACLYYYKLVSDYPCDVTKNCRLTINEIDSNFYQLKGDDIKTAEFIREDKSLILTRNNGDKLIVPLKDVTYNLETVTGCNESGMSLTISYDAAEGPKTVTLSNILTYDNLRDVIGSDILTEVITDNTLKGKGTMRSPLGLAGVEKTGTYAPVKGVIDTTNGERLPEVAKLGTRYITKEYVNDYGYLYNGYGVNQISAKLVEDKRGWRVPSKADWDTLLNSIEPCGSSASCRNHASAACHKELGCTAGSDLKSECGWDGQDPCECGSMKPFDCSYEFIDADNDEFSGSTKPKEKDCPIGVDKYGMTILPAGAEAPDTHGKLQTIGFGESAYFWTTTHLHPEHPEHSDVYVKEFDWDKCGVYQIAECPNPYYSVRLVKDFDGSNYFGSVDFDGVTYNTVLFAEAGQIWITSNYYGTENIDEENYAEVNNGVEIPTNRTEYFINEWNGKYWERKKMNEADTVVVENTCFDQSSGTTIEVCFKNEEGIEECKTVDIPNIHQRNIEYRVYTEDKCNKVLVNTDNLVVQRVLEVLLPMLLEEAAERKAADEALSGAIDTEREERICGDTELWDAIAQEASARTEVDNQLWDAIAQEASARTEVDNQLWDALNKEIEDRLDVDAQIWDAIAQEASARTDVDNQLWDAIAQEAAAREEVDNQQWAAIEEEARLREEIDNQQWDAINAEIARAKAREDEIEGQLIDPDNNPYTMMAAVGKDENNLELKSKDENPEHFIKINFDGNFGEM